MQTLHQSARSKRGAIMRAILVAAPLLAAGPAAAQKAGLKDAGGCAGDTQSEMNACAGASYAQADAALNAAYRRLTARLGQAGLSTRGLVAAQRAWITFRDAACEAETVENEGGSIRPMLVSACMERLTRQRTAELDGQR